MACRTSFLSRQRDVIASFFMWRELVHTEYFSDHQFIGVQQILKLVSCYIISNKSEHKMSSPGQIRGSCGHPMTSFDRHLYCARCRDKGKGKDTCVESKDSSDCVHCNDLTPEQRAQLATRPTN